jgi:predicted extracellular nuclease
MERMLRVYLPATFTILDRLADTHVLPTTPGRAFAVTGALREWYAVGDAEELEFAATLAAAHDAIRLLAVDPIAERRRVVIAADVPEQWVRPTPDFHPAAVTVTEAVPYDRLVSLLVDSRAAGEAVRRAGAVVLRADAGDPEAQFEVDATDDEALEWYALDELEQLIGRV